MNRTRYGFTLIEMLAVIAIIGLLAGILLPVLATVRRSAKITTCKNNLVQFSRDIDIYRANWDLAYPFYLSNMVPKRPVDLGNPKNFVCALDWTGGVDGGVPVYVKNTKTPFLPSEQYDETDDTEKNAAYAQYRNTEVTRCSYMYEFCIADCSWEPGFTWLEKKLEQMKEGADGKYAGGHVPIVRCFWHGKQRSDGSGYIKDKAVLNIGVNDRAVYNSSPRWEDDL